MQRQEQGQERAGAIDSRNPAPMREGRRSVWSRWGGAGTAALASLLLLLLLLGVGPSRIRRSARREASSATGAVRVPQELLAGPFMPFSVDDIRARAAHAAATSEQGCSSALGPFCTIAASANLARTRVDGRVTAIGDLHPHSSNNNGSSSSSDSSRHSVHKSASTSYAASSSHRQSASLDDTIAIDEALNEGDTLSLTRAATDSDGDGSIEGAKDRSATAYARDHSTRSFDDGEGSEVHPDAPRSLFANRVGALHIQGGESASSIGAELWSPHEATGIRSYPSKTRRSLMLHNMRSEELQVYWLDFEGKEQPIVSLLPGELRRLMTFVGHAFTIRQSTSGKHFGSVMLLGDHENLQTGWQREVVVGIDTGSRVHDPLDDYEEA